MYSKIDPLFEDFEEMQSIFSMGHMKSRLDGRPSTFSDSSFGTVCLFLFVDCSSWPNLTAACAAQVAKQVVLSSFRHGNTLWRARCRFRNRLRGLVTILVHLYLCDLLWSYIHHNSCRKNRFLLRFCVSIQDIQGHSWRIYLVYMILADTERMGQMPRRWVDYNQEATMWLRESLKQCKNELFTRVLAQHNYSRITGFSFWGPFSKSWCAKVAKAVLGVHTLQLSHRSGRKSRFARQPVMGHLMVLMSLKLCNSNCFVSRCTQKLIRSLKILKRCKVSSRWAIWKSSLDGRPSTFSDSSFGTVCFLFVDCSSWPNLTAACAAQVAKQVVLSSFRHGNTPLARPLSLPKQTQRLGDNLSAFVPVWSIVILYTSQLLQKK